MTKVTWKRAWDGAQFTGTVVRELPKYHSVVVEPDGEDRRIVVHESNIIAAAGVVSAKERS